MNRNRGSIMVCIITIKWMEAMIVPEISGEFVDILERIEVFQHMYLALP